MKAKHRFRLIAASVVLTATAALSSFALASKDAGAVEIPAYQPQAVEDGGSGWSSGAEIVGANLPGVSPPRPPGFPASQASPEAFTLPATGASLPETVAQNGESDSSDVLEALGMHEDDSQSVPGLQEVAMAEVAPVISALGLSEAAAGGIVGPLLGGTAAAGALATTVSALADPRTLALAAPISQ